MQNGFLAFPIDPMRLFFVGLPEKQYFHNSIRILTNSSTKNFEWMWFVKEKQGSYQESGYARENTCRN